MFYCFKLNETCFHTPGLWNIAVPRYRWCSKRSYHRSWENQTALKGTPIGQKTGSIFDNFLLLGLWFWIVGSYPKLSGIHKRTQKSVEWLHGFQDVSSHFEICTRFLKWVFFMKTVVKDDGFPHETSGHSTRLSPPFACHLSAGGP